MPRAYAVTLILLTLILEPFDTAVQTQAIGSKVAYSPLVTNCYTTPCRGKNEWPGGTIGGRSDIDLHFHSCDAGCEFIEVGVWGKLSSDGSYLGIMTESAHGNITWYVWKKYSPSTGNQVYYVSQVPTGDQDRVVNFEVSWPGTQSTGEQYVHIGSPTQYWTIYTGVTTRVWDRIQVGARLRAQTGVTATIYDYRANNNQWRLGNNGYYYNQQANGYVINDATDWLRAYWIQLPSQSSTGGIWDGNCTCP